jgi:hypothetical protein
MNRRAAALLAIAALAGPVAAAQPLNLDRWAGVYKTRFENGAVDGTVYSAENILEIVKLSPRTAYLRIHLEFYNGHECNIWGVADAVGDHLAYRTTAQRGEKSDDEPCVLQVVREKDRLTLHDNQTCKPGYCGVRGSFENVGFSTKRGQPIRYIARLRASQPFKAALAERRQAR